MIFFCLHPIFGPDVKKCIFVPTFLYSAQFVFGSSFSLLKMLKISRVSKKGTNHLERVLFMWPALVWERAIMKESKNLTSGGIVSHTGSRKGHLSLRKVIDLGGDGSG